MPEINIHLGGDGWGEAGAAGDFELALEELKEQISMRARLPQLLSRVVLAGYREEALAALVAWGSGGKTVRQVWQEVAALLPGAAEYHAEGRVEGCAMQHGQRPIAEEYHGEGREKGEAAGTGAATSTGNSRGRQ